MIAGRSICSIVGTIIAFNLIYVAYSVLWTPAIPTAASSGKTRARSGQFLFGEDDESIDGLTAAQCTKRFPKLYHEVDRAVAFWKDRQHIISAIDINTTWVKEREGTVRILIHDGELRIIDSHVAQDWHFSTRTIGILSLIQRALDSAIAGGEYLPTIETSITFPDTVEMDPSSDHTVWTVGRQLSNRVHDRYWLIPNYDFWYDAPMAYRETRRRMMEHDSAFKEKIPKVVWRGSTWVDRPLREALLAATESQAWADVVSTEVDDREEELRRRMSLPDMCKYAFTAHTEGVSYSGRLDFILNCKSLPIVHDLNWAVFYTHLLEPSGPRQNYALVQRNWTDLEQTVQHYLHNPQDAEKVIANSLETFRRNYLTRAARSCYIRRLIQGYSSVSFSPDPYRSPGVKGEARGLRGISFEEYIYRRADGDFEDGWPDA
ncbi:putative lipopolysaccharide-modifying enzyme [Teratosphaeria destructans]|uniref:Lipopolysaccharide-modifying enzyme n=1 Tax=Teratosphaeria destructans TaxID=418781 RepID=A0A9W7W6R0_9PEZI|nr:putative lipopolysaccharide-modifying enzyme [Teratosphaeria destructans]